MDRLLGGAGLRRADATPMTCASATPWTSCAWKTWMPTGRVRLKTEMKLPCRAWLQYEVWEAQDGSTQLEQTAAFIPKGLSGLAY